MAGDLLSSVRRDSVTGQNESHIGTLFYAFSEGSHSPVDVRKDESDRIDNMIDVTSKAFQGLTVSCARCHDHKFDPIATKEYYALYGIMESSRFSPVPAIRTLKQEESIKKNNELKVYIRKIIADQWKTEMSNENKKSDSKKNAVDERGDKIAANLFVIGDFRGSDLQGWKSDGIAFGQHTTLGSPLFNEKNELIGLEEGESIEPLLRSRHIRSLAFAQF
ncbi:MAG: DUF1549 domain-containing protein [Saprospiraceae bacterium]|nr:DUF1549 domain-containing protein [Saprospiraceae bacterium]